MATKTIAGKNVEVNEEGTEAAAVSKAPLSAILSPPLPSVPFTSCVSAGKFWREKAALLAPKVTTWRPACAVASATPSAIGRRSRALA